MSLQEFAPIVSHDAFSGPTAPKDYVAHLLARSGSSFTLGMKMLARPRREAIFAVYAFCRVVDDIADEAGTRDEKRALLEAWKAEIAALYAGRPRSLIGRALAAPVAHFHLPEKEFLLMIKGMEADVNGPIQAPSLTDLLVYTRQVAGTVGMLAIRIFGVGNHGARDPFALYLADAFQLTNILRDIEEDAEIDRLYLPREILLAHGIESTDPKVVAAHSALVGVRRQLGAIARGRFNEARRALQSLEGEPVRAALIMMGVYEGYLDRMEAEGFSGPAARRSMPKWQKLVRGLHYGFAFPKRTLPAPDPAAPPLASVAAE